MISQSRVRAAWCGFIVVLASVCVSAQAPMAQAGNASDACHGYDVVSIRSNVSGNDKPSIDPTADSISATNVSLKTLLADAYGLREEQIFGLSGWALTHRFDLVAKMSDCDEAALKSLSWRQRRDDLTKVLTERFHIVSHTEIRTLPVYELMLIKGATKLKQSLPAGPNAEAGALDSSQTRGNMIVTTRFLEGTAVPLSTLATALSGLVGREVIDKTDNAGLYDVSLHWVPLEASAPPDGDPDIRSALYTALREQLGLKLLSSKGPVKTVVVDDIETPTAN